VDAHAERHVPGGPAPEVEQPPSSPLGRWRTAPESAEPVTQVTLLGANWLRLLRADLRVPPHHLPTDWPAGASFDPYRQLRGRLSRRISPPSTSAG
jgi:hypothetical protein